jgi:preprotein translocase subunit SecG
MLYSVLLIFQVIISISLVTFILLQHGKGADAGAAFGSGASTTVFGSQGSTSFLSRTTAILATLFFLNSLAMAYLISSTTEAQSVVEQAIIQEQAMEEESPAADIPEQGPAAGDAPADVPN